MKPCQRGTSRFSLFASKLTICWRRLARLPQNGPPRLWKLRWLSRLSHALEKKLLSKNAKQAYETELIALTQLLVDKAWRVYIVQFLTSFSLLVQRKKSFLKLFKTTSGVQKYVLSFVSISFATGLVNIFVL